jgi:Flp pilus assembly protein TadD
MRQQVVQAANAGISETGIPKLRQRLAHDPTDQAARLKLAELYEAQGFPEIAVDHVRTALQGDPGNTGIRLRLVSLLRKLELLDDAIATLRDAPPCMETASMLGILLDEQERYGEGETAHRQALEFNFNSSPLRNNLGLNLMAQGRQPDAVREFRMALALDVRNSAARSNLAAALDAERDRDEILAHWKTLSGAPAAHNNLAALLIAKGDFKQARAELETALRLEPDFVPAWRNLQLVSELDGGTAQVRAPRPETTAWQRFKAALKRSLIRTDEGNHPHEGVRQTP